MVVFRKVHPNDSTCSVPEPTPSLFKFSPNKLSLWAAQGSELKLLPRASSSPTDTVFGVGLLVQKKNNCITLSLIILNRMQECVFSSTQTSMETETIFYSVPCLKTNFIKRYLHFSFPYLLIEDAMMHREGLKSILVKENIRGDMWRVSIKILFYFFF